MKKLLFVIVCSMLGLNMFAKDGLIIKSGDVSFLKEKTIAVIVMDFSNATWQEDQMFKDWCSEDYENRITISKNGFINSFNKNSRGLNITDSSVDAKYRITIRLKDLEWRMGMRSMWGQMIVGCWGTIIVEDITSGNIICEIEINNEKGDPDFVPNDRFESCFKNMGKRFAKLK